MNERRLTREAGDADFATVRFGVRLPLGGERERRAASRASALASVFDEGIASDDADREGGAGRRTPPGGGGPLLVPPGGGCPRRVGEVGDAKFTDGIAVADRE